MLTAESAIAYVRSNFAGSFESIVGAGPSTEAPDAVDVTVMGDGVESVAVVWIDLNGQIYGEL